MNKHGSRMEPEVPEEHPTAHQLRNTLMGGVQTQILTTSPVHLPWEVQFVQVVRTTFGPNLAPKAPIFFFFWCMVGVKNLLHRMCVCSKCSGFVGNSNVHAKQGQNFHP